LGVFDWCTANWIIAINSSVRSPEKSSVEGGIAEAWGISGSVSTESLILTANAFLVDTINEVVIEGYRASSKIAHIWFSAELGVWRTAHWCGSVFRPNDGKVVG